MKTIDQIKSAIWATRFLGHHTFEWFGKRPIELTPMLKRILPPEVLRQHRDRVLCWKLYENFYRHGYARPIRWDGDGVRGGALAQVEFIAALSAANLGRGWHDSGWTLERLEPPRAVIRRAGLAVTAFLDDLLSDNALEVGAEVALARPVVLPSLSPGFHTIVGNAGFVSGDTPLLRYYWNVSATGAPALIRCLTDTLDAACAAFRIKVANAPAGYDRCDSAVLYLHSADHERLFDAIGRAHAALAPNLDHAVPVFCRALAPGLGLAEDPPGSASFGLSRCEILARGLAEAHAAGRDPMKTVAAAFEETGISLAAPHLNPGSVDRYPAYLSRPSASPTRSLPPGNALEAARAAVAIIAALLRRHAIRQEGRCTWVAPLNGNPAECDLWSLGPELYAGLAGVAMFLAEHARMAQDDASADVARAAMRQAERRLESVPARLHAALFSGWTGIAVAGHRIAQALDEPALARRARQVGLRSVATAEAMGGRDLIAGDAGAILGMLYLARHFGDRTFLRTATTIGDRLLSTAERSGQGASWRTINRAREYRLTGLSHGVAGIAFALFRLSQATGVDRFAETGSDALAFEQNWYDPERCNWPDLRESRPGRGRRQSSRAFSTFWCHGAPGIALSRLAAYDVTGDSAFREQARAAIATTLRSISPRDISFADCILCHGTLGNADILLSASRRGEARPDEIAELARHAAAKIAGCSEALGAGPAAYARTHPGLMTGMSGAGWFFLRLLDPTVPSVLNGMTEDIDAPGQQARILHLAVNSAPP